MKKPEDYGIKSQTEFRPLGALLKAFDSRQRGGVNQQHVATIQAALEGSNGRLKVAPWVTKDNYAVTGRHGIEASLRYFEETLGSYKLAEQQTIPVVVLNLQWENASEENNLLLRKIAFEENSGPIKLANEYADVQMMVNHYVRNKYSDEEIKKELSGSTPAALLNKAIRYCRQLQCQALGNAYVELRKSGTSKKKALEATGVSPQTAARREKILANPRGEQRRLRSHKVRSAATAFNNTLKRAADEASSFGNYTQAERRSVIEAAKTALTRMKRAVDDAEVRIEDYIRTNYERIRG